LAGQRSISTLKFKNTAKIKFLAMNESEEQIIFSSSFSTLVFTCIVFSKFKFQLFCEFGFRLQNFSTFFELSVLLCSMFEKKKKTYRLVLAGQQSKPIKNLVKI
jgi:hypothetical protein